MKAYFLCLLHCILLNTLSLLAIERTYAVHTILSRDELENLVKGHSGIILGHIPDTYGMQPSNIFHVKFPDTAVSSNQTWRRHPKVLSVQFQVPLQADDLRAIDFLPEPDYPTSEIPKHNVSYEVRYRRHANALRQRVKFNDPSARGVWQYLNDGSNGSLITGYDINIFPAYRDGYTGNGSTVVVVDDGMDNEHDDLRANYNAEISINLRDPTPNNTSPRGPHEQMEDGHGTNCAGLVAAVANNSLCSHGVAFGAKLGAVRMKFGWSYHITTAIALSNQLEKVDIYTNSWEGLNDGKTMHRLPLFVSKVLHRGSREGRHGLGAVYIFSAGNGALNGDDCAADGYRNAPQTIVVAALDTMGKKAPYSESCSAVRVAVPVGSNLATTAENNGCRRTFGGTSAAAPIAAGCLALVLEANRNLSSRDLEHLLSWSARIPNANEQGWLVNSAGLLYNRNVGFGLLDCYAMIKLAQVWTNVGNVCVLRTSRLGFLGENFGNARLTFLEHSPYLLRRWIAPGHIRYLRQMEELKIGRYATSSKIGSITIHKRRGKFDHSDETCVIDVVEKVIVRIQFHHICRGTLLMELVSPSGTKIKLLDQRPLDAFAGQSDLTIYSVGFLGEPIIGKWVLLIKSPGTCFNDTAGWNRFSMRGVVRHTEFQFWGTEKSNSAFELNKQALDQMLTTVGRGALKTGTGRELHRTEIETAMEEQRWRSLLMSSVDPKS